MRSILTHCGDLPLETVPAGTVLLTEGQTSGHVYVLVRGRIEVLRGDTQIVVLDEPGSLVGEMSVLLDVPHTATARTLDESTVHVIVDGDDSSALIPICLGSSHACWPPALTSRRPISLT